MKLPVVRRGSTRTVLTVGPIAFKVGRGKFGFQCNLYEADLYRRCSPRRREMLCPVIACAPNGSVLLARACEPLSEIDFKEIWEAEAFPDWDYWPPNDDECPFEWKASDWGRLEGKLVALDYSAPVLPVPS